MVMPQTPDFLPETDKPAKSLVSVTSHDTRQGEVGTQSFERWTIDGRDFTEALRPS